MHSVEGPQGVQAYRLDLKGGVQKVLTSASAMHPRALALSPDDRTVYSTDGDRLIATPAGGGRGRDVYKAESPAAWARGFSLSEEGGSLVLLDGAKLVSVSLAATGKYAARTLAEVEPGVAEPVTARSGVVLYRDAAKGIYLAGGGAKPKRLGLEGSLGPLVWNPGGQSFLFLRTNQGPGKANSLHEYSLETQKESLIGKTSQFVHFNRNADSSVFVGASGSKAQPFVLIMLRVTRRELALCEHKASDAAMVSPVFAPSSKRLYFQSDRLGKPAIFSVAVERIVEPTEEEEPAKKT